MYKRHILGKQGEEIAIYYLNKKGYKILEKNFLCRQGEIDVIALDDNYIIFIEIKSRTNTEFGLPSESVTKKKIKKILKAASYYLYIRNLENLDVRIDAIEVYIKQEKYYINHIKQII